MAFTHQWLWALGEHITLSELKLPLGLRTPAITFGLPRLGTSQEIWGPSQRHPNRPLTPPAPSPSSQVTTRCSGALAQDWLQRDLLSTSRTAHTQLPATLWCRPFPALKHRIRLTMGISSATRTAALGVFSSVSVVSVDVDSESFGRAVSETHRPPEMPSKLASQSPPLGEAIWHSKSGRMRRATWSLLKWTLMTSETDVRILMQEEPQPQRLCKQDPLCQLVTRFTQSHVHSRPAVNTPNHFPKGGTDDDPTGHISWSAKPLALSNTISYPSSANMYYYQRSKSPKHSKKMLNVESPSFTPASLQQPQAQAQAQAQPPPQQLSPQQQQQQAAKKSTFSSQAASAAVFTPRGTGGQSPTYSAAMTDEHALMAPPAATPQESDSAPPSLASASSPAPAPPTGPAAATTTFNPGKIQEFTPQPQNYDLLADGAAADTGSQYDPFAMGTSAHSLAPTPFNPYANDQSNMSGPSAAYFQSQTGYAAPPQPVSFRAGVPIGC